MKKKGFIALSLFFIAAVLISGCSKTDGNLKKIQLNEVAHSVFYAPQYVALELGYFKEEGLRYNMGRVHINSCDFALGNYTYVTEGDMTLESFDIAHDKKYIIPLIKKAMNEQEIHFLASPWSPPAYMKTNGEMNHGGKLKEEFYGLWAEYFIKYINAYNQAGITIKYVTN